MSSLDPANPSTSTAPGTSFSTGRNQLPFSIGDHVVLCNFPDDDDNHDDDLQDPINGQIGVVVGITNQGTAPEDVQYLIRLAHREPEYFMGLKCCGGVGEVVEIRTKEGITGTISEGTINIKDKDSNVKRSGMGNSLNENRSPDSRKAEMLKMLEQLENGNETNEIATIPTADVEVKNFVTDRITDKVKNDPSIPNETLIVSIHAENLRKISGLKMSLNLATFGGYVEIDDNTCGAAMLVGTYNACHSLRVDPFATRPKHYAAPPDFRSNPQPPADIKDARQETVKIPSIEQDLPSGNSRRGSVSSRSRSSSASSAIKAGDRNNKIQNKSKKNKTPKTLSNGLQILAKTAQKSLTKTQDQLSRRGQGDQVLEQRVKRLTKAINDLTDKNAPCTWSIGNLEIQSALTDLKLNPGILINREMGKSSPELSKLDEKTMKDWLWKEIWECGFGTGSGGLGKMGRSGGNGTGGDVLLFHLHGVLNKNCFFGHFALIFGIAEGEEVMVDESVSEENHEGKGRRASINSLTIASSASGSSAEEPPPARNKTNPSIQVKNKKTHVTTNVIKFRRVLTARSYQGPRHWVDLDKVYKWIFQSKFAGYEIVCARCVGR